jgi:hypothetical protein
MVLGDFNCIISDLDTKSGNMATSYNLKLILENIIAYIKDIFPKDITNENDMRLTDFWYDTCPEIGWVESFFRVRKNSSLVSSRVKLSSPYQKPIQYPKQSSINSS